MSEHKLAVGEWQQAVSLASAAKALEIVDDSDDDTVYARFFSCDARVFGQYIRCCLFASKFDDAAQAVREFESKTLFGCCAPRLLFSQVDVALAQGDFVEFDRLTRLFQAAADSRSSYELDLWALDRRVRSLLLNPELGDPLNWNHPAMVLLRSARRIARHLNERFRMSLLLVDFRLAALRVSVGVIPVDDVYGSAIPQLQSSHMERNVDRTVVSQRATRACTSASQAMKQATKLDIRWDCDWRRRVIEQRIARISALVGLAP